MNAGLRWYLTSTGLFLVPSGIQMVMFPFLVAVYLQESPARVGIAQMASQLPMLLLILWGGLLGDRVDQRRLLIGLQLAMAIPPLIMAWLVWGDLLYFEVLVGWALVGGVFGAFAQPARDALLNRVAGRDIQRVVTLAVGVQFGIQVVGFGIGSTADRFGPAVLMVIQSICMVAAAVATARMPTLPPQSVRVRRSALAEIADGIGVAWRAPEIRAAILLTFSVGVFFAGTYMVLLPLMVRDLYQGSAAGIAAVFAANMLGTCTTIVFLMRRGGVQRPGRALLIGGSLSVSILSLLHFELSITLFYLVVYLWGLCGGISMTMSRAIVQEASPESHRARILSVYSLGMMGGMPIGSLLLGWCVGVLGVRHAVLVPVVGMAVVLVAMRLGSGLWRVERALVEPNSAGAG
jgi:MFS family permease